MSLQKQCTQLIRHSNGIRNVIISLSLSVANRSPLLPVITAEHFHCLLFAVRFAFQFFICIAISHLHSSEERIACSQPISGAQFRQFFFSIFLQIFFLFQCFHCIFISSENSILLSLVTIIIVIYDFVLKNILQLSCRLFGHELRHQKRIFLLCGKW